MNQAGINCRGSIHVVVLFVLVFTLVVLGLSYYVKEFRLTPTAHTIAVRVEGKGGPVSGATVTLYNTIDIHGSRGVLATGVTDAKGMAKLDAPHAHLSWLVITSKGYGRWVSTYQGAKGTVPVDVLLLSAASIGGVVRSAEKPAEKTWVALVTDDEEAFFTETNSRGEYEFTELPPGGYDVIPLESYPRQSERARLRGPRVPDPGRQHVVLFEGSSMRVDLTLDTSLISVDGTVTLNGVLVPSILVSIEVQNTELGSWSAVATGVTDSKGRFEIREFRSREEMWITARYSRQQWQVEPRFLRQRFVPLGKTTSLAMEAEPVSVAIGFAATDVPVQAYFQFSLGPDIAGGGVPGFPDDYSWILQGGQEPKTYPFFPSGSYRTQVRRKGGTMGEWQRFQVRSGGDNTVTLDY